MLRTIVPPSQAERTVLKHIRAITKVATKTPEQPVHLQPLSQKQQPGFTEGGACFSHAAVSSMLKQTPFLSPKASHLSLKEISVLFPKPPAKKKPLPFATACFLVCQLVSVSPFLTEHLFAMPFHNNFHDQMCASSSLPDHQGLTSVRQTP